MSMNFDRSGDPNPIPADLAVKRGVLLINWPVRLIMFGGFALAWFLGDKLPLLAIIIGLLAIPMAWLWWSYFVPQWRRWAHRRGADSVKLQELGEYASLVWPRGSFFERTEFRGDER
jgi:hypothetical protein